MLVDQRDRFTIETAEGEILATAIIRPDLWPHMPDVVPEWFTNWSDQRLWQAVLAVRTNGFDFVDPGAVQHYLQQHCPKETEGLMARLAAHVARWLHPEYLRFHYQVLRQSGVRHSCDKWADVIKRKCLEQCPLQELKIVVTDPPTFGEEVVA